VCPRGHLLHLVGWRGDAEVATASTAAPSIGTALALEVQAIASPAAMLRKKSVLRMNVSPEVHETNGAPFQFHVRSAATEKGRAPLADRRRRRCSVSISPGSIPARRLGAKAAALV
jgi:hypothetical protein